MGCQLCPRHCGTDRHLSAGVCGAPEEVCVSAVCLHRGEEPPISGTRGIVNVFFSYCNLHCIYCQNEAISGQHISRDHIHIHDIDTLADRIAQLLPSSNGLLGFVTPTHYAHQLADIVEAVEQRGMHPTVVYNSSGYENIDTLRSLEGLIDIYLPDFKYMDVTLAAQYSHAADYPTVAKAALKEMRRQVGVGLKEAEGIAYRGLIVRHLVLPGATENTRQCLAWLHEAFGPALHLSLMAQYFPPRTDLPAPLNRSLTEQEYIEAIAIADQYAFEGWTQELTSGNHYRPDFSRTDNPFEP